jgi:hypothetical protein
MGNAAPVSVIYILWPLRIVGKDAVISGLATVTAHLTYIANLLDSCTCVDDSL